MKNTLRDEAFDKPLYVHFFDNPNSPEIVDEIVIMPSGTRVVMTKSGESLWFDRKGKHPKSELRLGTPNQVDELREFEKAHEMNHLPEQDTER